jgi:hypothetical protein
MPKETDLSKNIDSNLNAKIVADVDMVSEEAGLPLGYVTDFISGRLVRATPEEINAVQVFARRLVEDFNYPKDCIQTRPQFRVRARPSQETRGRGYPAEDGG